jgi:anti-sigma B factor antagonist
MVRAHEWDVSRLLGRVPGSRQPWWAAHPDPVEPELGLEVSVAGGRAVVVVRGDVDAHTAPELEVALQELPLAGVGTLEVEMAEVASLGSVGLTVLVEAQRRCEQAGVELVLCHVRDSVWRLFEVTGLDRLFTTHPPRPVPVAAQELSLF